MTRRPSGPGRLVGLGLLVWPLSSCVEQGPLPWQEEAGHRWRALDVAGREAPGFTTLSPSRTGVDVVNVLSEANLLDNDILSNGSGVAIGDVDGDDRVDIYLASLEGPNTLYRNLGDWRFEEIAEAAGAALPDRVSRGAVFADVDGDTDLDLLVTVHAGPNVLLLNDGSGVFEDATERSGLAKTGASHTATLADVDGDGDLDLYVANYRERWARDAFSPRELAFDSVFERRGEGFEIAAKFRDYYRIIDQDGVRARWEFGEPDEFYLNDGSGRFEQIAFTAGRFLDSEGRPLTREPDEWGLTARFYDMDSDGDPDLYVANDINSPDHIWLNDGKGVFTAAEPLAIRTTSNASMAVDFSDIDRDGDVDHFVTEMLSRDLSRRKTQSSEAPLDPTRPGEIAIRPQVKRNTLQLSRGDGSYAEIARFAGVEASDWTWGTLFLDVDLDGYEDLVVGTGNILDWLNSDARQVASARLGGSDWRTARLLFPPLPVRNMAFRNRGDLRFEEVGEAWGLGSEPDISHGLAAGDLDGDGDSDLVINRLNAPALLLRNDGREPRVAVRLRGPDGNTRGIGAKIRLLGGPVASQEKEVTAGGLYLSGSEPTYSFATGPAPTELTIEVEWPGGTLTRLEVQSNRLYELFAPPREAAVSGGAGSGRASSGDPVSAPFFVDAGADLDHVHTEPIFDEFNRQPLLPLRLAQLGPGVSWQDTDGDGDPDLLIGSGRDGRLAHYRNDAGRFVAQPSPLPPAQYDQTTILGLPNGSGGIDLLVGQMNYEASGRDESVAAPAVLRARLRRRAGDPRPEPTVAVAGDLPSVGPLALADVDGDGDLDLFVGSRVFPTGYPVPPPSRLYRNIDGRFEPDGENREVFLSAGLVSAVVFSDLDVDGDPDLLLATEWGPIRLFVNGGGRFVERTGEWGLEELTGRWNGVATGDLDEDGRPDIIATGWGENTDDRPAPDRPLLLYYGDFDTDGTVDPIEAQLDPALGDVVPLRRLDELERGLHYLRRNVETHEIYSRSSLVDVLGPPASSARVLEAATLSHLVLLNRGGRFDVRSLPPEAQFAPAFYAGVADYDGDGHEDVFVGQNFFATPLQLPRQDAGRSLWLRGDGSGSLTSVPGRVSGIAVYGDPRGAALADYDEDGRIDLAVSQNGARTRLFRNVAAVPGLRVRLDGPPDNPAGIGASIRVEYADGLGPAREVQAGSGYWSQNGAVQVMGLRADPVAVRVRWSGGLESRQIVEPGTREVSVSRAGATRRSTTSAPGGEPSP